MSSKTSPTEAELRDRYAQLMDHPLPSAGNIIKHGEEVLRSRTEEARKALTAKTAALDRASRQAFDRIAETDRQMKKGRAKAKKLIGKIEEHTKKIKEALPSGGGAIRNLPRRYTAGVKRMHKHIKKYIEASKKQTHEYKELHRYLNNNQQAAVAAFKKVKDEAEKVGGGDLPRHTDERQINAWIEHLAAPRAAVVRHAHVPVAQVVGAAGGESKATGGSRRTRSHKRKRRRRTRRRRKKRKTRRRPKKRHRRTRRK